MPLQRAFSNLEDAEFFAKNGVVSSASSRPRKSPLSAKSKKSSGKEEDEVEDEIEDEEDEAQDEPTIAPTATKRDREEVEDEEEVEEPKAQAKTPAAKRQKKNPAADADEMEEAAGEEQQEEPKPQTKTPAAKKQKKTTIPAATEEEELDETAHEPGTGPLPKGATDGFDPRVILTPITSKDGTPGIEYKFKDQRNVWKMQPQGRRKATCIDIYTDGSCRANGQGQKAVAGWGVYFGPYHGL